MSDLIHSPIMNNGPFDPSDKARRRRRAAERVARSARILVCENLPDGSSPMASSVRALGFEAQPCATLADALRETSVAPYDMVIAVLPGADDARFSMLQLLRRALPTLPVVVVSSDGSLDLRARIQPLRPYYFAVPPVSEDELRAIVNGAVAQRAARA